MTILKQKAALVAWQEATTWSGDVESSAQSCFFAVGRGAIARNGTQSCCDVRLLRRLASVKAAVGFQNLCGSSCFLLLGLIYSPQFSVAHNLILVLVVEYNLMQFLSFSY